MRDHGQTVLALPDAVQVAGVREHRACVHERGHEVLVNVKHQLVLALQAIDPRLRVGGARMDDRSRFRPKSSRVAKERREPGDSLRQAKEKSAPGDRGCGWV